MPRSMLGGAAARAGIRAIEVDRRGKLYFDVIVGIDDIPIRSYDDLYRALDAREPGEGVVLRLRCDGREHQVELVLQELE